MAQVLFASDTTPSLVDLDADMSEVYALKQLVTTPAHSGYSAYTATNPLSTVTVNGFRFKSDSGATYDLATMSFVASTTVHWVLAGPSLGWGIKARWDGSTSDRYLAFGMHTSLGVWTEYFRFYENDFVGTSTGKIGYGTGAGGTVTQATSKSTGVTLSKTSGQITMNAASLAASTAVSFTLTNTLIAAIDDPHVTIASGATAGAYLVAVDAVAAGSCRVSLRNLTGGALAESVVLNFNLFKGSVT
jgi:hypothetical protein